MPTPVLGGTRGWVARGAGGGGGGGGGGVGGGIRGGGRGPHEVEEPAEQRLVRAVKGGREGEVKALLLSLGQREEVWRTVCAGDAEGKTAVHWACQYGHLSALCLLLAALPPHPAPVHPPLAPNSPSPCRHHHHHHQHHQHRLHPHHHHHHQVSLLLHRQPPCVPPSDPGDVSPAGGDVLPADVIPCHVSPDLCDVIPVHSDIILGVDGVRHSASTTATSTATTSTTVTVTNTTTTTTTTSSSLVDTDTGSEGSYDNDDTEGCVRCGVLNARDARGQTPLLAACNFRHTDVGAFLVTLPCCGLQARDLAGNTALHRAIHQGLDTVACMLCQAHADVRATNRQRLTPLHEAVRTGSHDVMRALLRRGCDVNACSSSKAAPTPFLTAIFYCRISPRGKHYDVDGTLRLLVQAGCRLSQGDSQWTPLSATVDTDNSHIAALLLYHGCRIPKQRSGRSVLVEAFAKCTPLVVTLLVACGYQPSREEVDQCARRIPAFSPLFYRICTAQRAAMKAKVTLLDWLRQRATQAPSLLELSRGAVRAALNRATGDTSILSRVHGLPLPRPLLHYVSLSQLVTTADLEL